MDLNECYRKGFVKKTRIDKELIISLTEMSNANEKTIERANLDSITISSYVSMAYESLRQILEAVCTLNGYKVLSHLCLGELLKTLVDDFDFNEFDRMRYTRNGVNYYGVKVDLEQGKEIIRKMLEMKNKLAKKYLKEFIK